MYETAGKHYQMDPKTEDLLANGRQLQNGMVVLLSDTTLREHHPNEDGEFRDEYAKQRYLETNRWCVVTEFQNLTEYEQVIFVGLYEDGTKVKRQYDWRYPWLVKKVEDGSYVFFDRPEQFVTKDEAPSDGLESEEVDPVFRVVATYQMFGDMTGRDWFDHVFSYHKEHDNVEDYQFLVSLTGAWGLQYVTFTVDLALDLSKKQPDHALIEELATGMLNGLIGDSDVLVTGFQYLGYKPTKS